VVLNLKPIRTWTQEDLDQMKALRAEGKTHAQIAEALGRTKASVCKQWLLARTQPALKRGYMMTEERRRLLLELWAEGVAQSEILTRLNKLPGDPISGKAYVRKVAQKYGVPRPDGHNPVDLFTRTVWTDDRIAIMKRMRPAGFTAMEVLAAVNKLPGKKISSHRQVFKGYVRYGAEPAPASARSARIAERNRRLAAERRANKPVVEKVIAEKAPRVRVAKPKAERSSGVPSAVVQFAPSPVRLEPRKAGWPEISRWWREQTGKFDPMPDLSAVNALRRKQGRAPFQPVYGMLVRGAA